jgi:hypothetical protein
MISVASDAEDYDPEPMSHRPPHDDEEIKDGFSMRERTCHSCRVRPYRGVTAISK